MINKIVKATFEIQGKLVSVDIEIPVAHDHVQASELVRRAHNKFFEAVHTVEFEVQQEESPQDLMIDLESKKYPMMENYIITKADNYTEPRNRKERRHGRYDG